MGCCDRSKSKTRRWSWIILLAVVVIVILVIALSDARGQTTIDGAAAATSNQTCPVMTDEAIDPEQWIEYEGKRVYFCCRMCKRKFEREPQSYLANLPQFANGATDGHGHAHTDANASPQTGNTESHVHDESEPDRAASSGGHDHDDHYAGANLGGNGDGEHGEPTDSDSHDDEVEHDHAAHEHDAGSTGLAKLVSWLGKFHPPVTDFPVALLLSAAIAEMLLMVTGRSLFASAARFCVWLGSVSTIGAAMLGWFFAGFRLSDPDWIMTVHRWLGTAAGIWAILVLTLCIAAYRSDERGDVWTPWYRLTLFIGAAAVAANGFFGGAVKYGLDHYVW